MPYESDVNSRCVILPCGGKGSRLSLPYPKELHVVLPGKSMIDFTLDILRNIHPRPLLLVVITAEKPNLTHYLKRRCSEFDVHFIEQTAPNLIGAIESAIPHLATTNLVLLPDQVIEDDGAIERLFQTLENGAATAVLAHRREERLSLFDEGALVTEQLSLIGMAEKPGANCLSYDSAWCGIGFRREVAVKAVSTLKRLFQKGFLNSKDLHDSPFWMAPVLFVPEYVDLGVWERIVSYQKAHL